MEKIEFESEMISVKDLLKATNILPTGGMAKNIVREEGVILNGEICHSPGKKMYKGDRLDFDGFEITII
ncbi:MAG: RNA-binding S4 domain-containing protein [Anaerococcus sp.]|nr:RNA-binding S4 domain-containing protein [Anaerococcus sp.]